MKINFKYKFTAGAIILAMFAGKAQAQEAVGSQNIRSQYVNNSVPGLKYGPAKKAKEAKVKDRNEAKETIRMQLKKENIPGMKFAKGGGTIAKKTTPVNTDAAKTLPSAMPARVAIDKKVPVAATLPTQEEVTAGTKKTQN